ncbi:MAG: MATE family efflux transporter [Lachnospiraceae bacterium]
MNVTKVFAKYVSLNIFAMLGISCYIIADTFFISMTAGTDGIAALNLVLPVYSLIFAVGAMIGVGSATRFSIQRARTGGDAAVCFSNSVLFSLIFGSILSILGAFFPDKILSLFGGNARIISVGKSYTRTFMLFAPFFMLNHIFNAFVRNDGNPSLAMAATVISSLSNIVLDYLLMFPLHMGMTGAALATGLSPVIGLLICSAHFLRKDNSIHFCLMLPSVRLLGSSCMLGISAFIGEIASGVTTAVFNFLILGLSGNTGVAAYGIVANFSIVAVSIFNGITQGIQPLLSDFYGKGNFTSVKKVRNLGIVTAFGCAVLIIMIVFFFTDPLIAIFNSSHSAELAAMAYESMRLYFPGFLPAGFNIVCTGYFSAIERALPAFTVSVLRAVAAISAFALILSILFGMTGVWIAFAAAELFTFVICMFFLLK